MRLPINYAAAHFAERKMEGGAIQKAAGRAVHASYIKDAKVQIDQRHDHLCEQANEAYEASEGLNWGKLVGTLACAVPVFAGMFSFGYAAAGGAAMGPGAIIGGLFCASGPTVLAAFVGNASGQGIAYAAVEGDRDDMEEAKACAGTVDVAYRANERTGERSGKRNIDVGRDEENDAYRALLDLTNKKA